MRMTKGGFTLLECVLSLAIFSIISTAIFQLYLSGHILSRIVEDRVEIDQNLRISASRITDQIRSLDKPGQQISIDGKKLVLGPYRYYLLNDKLLEFKDGRANQLAVGVIGFDFMLEEGLLSISLTGQKSTKQPTRTLQLTIYVGQ